MNQVSGIQIARDRPIPHGTQVRLTHDGVDGHIHVHLQLPWQHMWTDLGLQPFVNKEIILPLRLAFLCHAKEDKTVVEQVGSRLLQDGFLTWYDEKDLLPGDRWERKIEEAIEGSDYVLLFLSPRTCTKTGYVQREFRLALQQRDRRPLGQRFIIPILIKPCEPPREFKDIQFLKFWQENAYDRLKTALNAPAAQGRSS